MLNNKKNEINLTKVSFISLNNLIALTKIRIYNILFTSIIDLKNYLISNSVLLFICLDSASLFSTNGMLSPNPL